VPQLTDRRVIEFLSKSPLKSFAAMLDTLRYLDGKWIWEDVEYELFDEPLGANRERKVRIRVPEVQGITANALLAFTWHAKASHLVRRRPRKIRDPRAEPDEIVVFYALTPAGKQMIELLRAIETARTPKK
jgi:hypothetical protein